MTVPWPPIEELLPHGPPMRLLDRLTDWTPSETTCEATVREDNLFARGDRVESFVLIEFMAQTVGAGIGYSRLRRGQAVEVGFLVGARDVHLYVDEVRVDDALVIRARHVWGDHHIGSFHCEVLRDDRLLAAGTLHAARDPSLEVSR